MDLIDRAVLKEEWHKSYDGEKCKPCNVMSGCTHISCEAYMTCQTIEQLPTIEAVPLEPLCEWLERNATMDCDGCRATIGSCEDDDVDEKVCNTRWRWKKMLTKWMEESNDH